jgi:deoxycytidine triphosphate deaminase
MIIMTVVVPEMLNKTLHQSTSYDVKIQNSIKKFQYTRLSTINEENQKITKIKRENHATVVEKNHEKEMAQINLEITKLETETDQIIK